MAFGGAGSPARSLLHVLDLQNVPFEHRAGCCGADCRGRKCHRCRPRSQNNHIRPLYRDLRNLEFGDNHSLLGLFCVKATAIAATMFFFLSCSNEGFTQESNTPIRRAVKLVVGSAVIVSACSFAVLACHLAMPHSMSCVVVYMIVSKVYHTCFLSLLGCRDQASAIHDPSMVAMQISEVGHRRESTVVDGSEAASFKA
ncbi:hypothetical protein C8F04DRAFT_1235041 [Mycena alexandri]|uniref:DUF6534 domain-containing protein n=1 Tax=Mycena alexandri TaxID=1745969 RepID=A0AAD6SSI8_9AGAR|nr:hypothetical protein C8F04DRAFT_1235041 [Mycena alexandri]